METLGAYAILLAFCLSIYAFAASVGGKLKRKPFLIVSGERAVYGVFVLLTTAAGILVYSLLISDFRLAYVAARSNRAMPLVYKFAAWWGGQEGSLLLWSWLLSTFAAVVVFTNRRKHRDMMPYVIAVLTFTQIFFCILNAFVEPPFQVLAVGKGVQAVADGNGLNPLLQYWLMAIHPPALYLGYVGFIVPFAFAFARWSPRCPARPGSHHAPLDHHLGLPIRRRHAGTGLGLRRSRLGRLLGMGPRGKRQPHALAGGHCLSAFHHDAEAAGDA